ncbi:guanylate kinase [Kiritimatiella glycovorans]|uniref:Guanylate kinase n=1 Tax=Kiritimatiella glycovorans TaxID=1307763 RepID=A0A0G3EB23_9BACT|nr:guanylate kinase [Kiritimatiella glycovorans]AKJ63488.1 Guanylate kinase [Kiritimatiella glycovorans]
MNTTPHEPFPDPRTPQRPLLLAVSAPSGTGKSTLCRRLLADFPSLTFSVSCTTRPPRPGERDGREYHFVSDEEFSRRIEEGAFLEHALVHGRRYGTLRQSVRTAMAAGRDVLLDIDPQGVEQVRNNLRQTPADDPLPRGWVDIFIAPPSREELCRRLESRGTETPEDLARRISNAAEEMRQRTSYAYTVINDDLEEACDRLRAIVLAEHCRNLREGDCG